MTSSSGSDPHERLPRDVLALVRRATVRCPLELRAEVERLLLEQIAADPTLLEADDDEPVPDTNSAPDEGESRAR